MKIHRMIVLLLFGLFLYGDVMYEMSTTTEGMMGMGGGETTISVFIKGDCSRTKMTSTGPMAGQQIITITRLDKGVIWTLDMDNEQYSEMKLGEETEEVEGEEETSAAMPEITVEKTGKKKVLLGKECEEVVVSMKVEDAEGSMNFTQTMWNTKDVTGYEEITEFNKKMTEKGMKSSKSSMMADKKSFDDFQNKINEIEGFPLELDLEMTMASEQMSFSMKTNTVVTKIDNKPINQKVFEIPVGYSLKE
ncbi:MAG: DUF4412 domain-containing protein [bacterium]